jgi:hypothetical protein
MMACVSGSCPADGRDIVAHGKDHETGDSTHLPAGPLLTNGVSLIQTDNIYRPSKTISIYF